MATWIYEARTGEGRVVRGTREADDRRSALESLRADGLFPTRLENRGGAPNGATQSGAAQNGATQSGAAQNGAAQSGVTQNGGGRAPTANRPRPPRPASAKAPPEPLRPARRAVESGFEGAPGGVAVTPDGSAVAPDGGEWGAANAAASPLDSPLPRKTAPAVAPAAAPRGATGAHSAAAQAAAQAKSAQMASAAAATPLETQPFLHASAQDLSNYFRQLSALMHAGTGLISALDSMAQHAGGRGLQEASRQIGARVRVGQPLSSGMRAFPGLFTPLMVGIVAAGERGGFMETSFTRLADYSERDHALQQAITRETWYPKLIVFCAIIIPGVVPLFLSGWRAMLAQIGPPLLLIALLFFAYTAFKYFRPAFASMAADPLQVGGVSFFKLYDEIKLKIPVVGKVARALASAKFCRALGALYSAGVGPREAIQLGADACGNRAIAARAVAQIPHISAGEPLTKCMEAANIFNPLALQMMRVGEESGDLDTQLDKAADFLETNAETAIKQAVPILGILAFLAVAAYVGSIVIGMYGGYINQLNGMMDQ